MSSSSDDEASFLDFFLDGAELDEEVEEEVDEDVLDEEEEEDVSSTSSSSESAFLFFDGIFYQIWE